VAADHHLAQINVAVLKEPLEAPLLAGFVAALEPINALADAASGFVWRLQTEDGDATAIRAFDDERIMLNLSVWESLEALGDFAYRSDHTDVMRLRRTWFHKMAEAYLALWWVPACHRPSVAEAKDRLDHLRVHGPTPHAFTFRRSYTPTGTIDERRRDDDRWGWPAS
jgi:Domain of unknown function (DUF3291)